MVGVQDIAENSIRGPVAILRRCGRKVPLLIALMASLFGLLSSIFLSFPIWILGDMVW